MHLPEELWEQLLDLLFRSNGHWGLAPRGVIVCHLLAGGVVSTHIFDGFPVLFKFAAANADGVICTSSFNLAELTSVGRSVGI